MTPTRRVVVAAAAVLACLLMTVALAACTGGPPDEPVAPGIKKGSLGGMEVVGYLERDGETWAVLDEEPDASSATEPTVLATLQPGSVDEAGIEALDGRYVWAAGRASDAKVPAIRVDGIEVAEVK